MDKNDIEYYLPRPKRRRTDYYPTSYVRTVYFTYSDTTAVGTGTASRWWKDTGTAVGY